MHKLIIEDDEGKTTVVPLIRDEISIGRKEGNTIRLTERNVSRRHARLLRQNGSIYIEDLQSYTGTKVNGDRVQGRAVVGEGDRIQIGDYQLTIKFEQPARGKAGDEPVTTPFVKATEQTTQMQVPPMPAPAAPTPAPAGAAVPVPPAIQTLPMPAMQQVAQPQGQKEKPARLVVVSKNFYRQEFPIDKAAVVIGRTDENDVVVNHRSISRHHAKIVREGGHYHIIDLQSANGVRVNGEEYGKVELRKGDRIDLGYVRLVFIPPGAEVDIGKAEETDPGEKRPTIALVLVVLLVLGGAVAALRYFGPSLLSTGPGKPTLDPESESAKLLLDVDTDLREMRWDDAVAKADRVLALAGASQRVKDAAQEKRAKAESEKRVQPTYDKFLGAGNDYDQAIQLYGQIPAESGYRQKATELYNKLWPLFVRKHLDTAEAARLRGDCGDVSTEVKKILAVEQNHIEAQGVLGKPCPEQPQRGEPGRKPPKTPKGGREPGVVQTPPGGSEPAEPREPKDRDGQKSPEEVDAALADAQKAYLNADYAKAIELARPVRGSATRAWRIIGAAACNLKDTKMVNEAYRKVEPNSRQFIVYVCLRNGLKLEGTQFKATE
jgi:pSer/pThr/pTyr-binding forkhead associated (FHA) protein